MRRFTLLLVLGHFWMTWVFASSTIFDGEVVKLIEGKVKQKIKGADGTIERVYTPTYTVQMKSFHSPYSSVALHAALQAEQDGTVRHFETRNLNQFRSYYIDDIPVTQEEILPLLKPGARISIMENRSFFYFLRVVTRAQEHKVGFPTGLEGRTLTLSRSQMAHSKQLFSKPEQNYKSRDADGVVNLNWVYYPWQEQQVSLDEDAVMQIDGKTQPATMETLSSLVRKVDYPEISDLRQRFLAGGNSGQAGGEVNASLRSRTRKMLEGRRAFLVQTARPRTRVEILPEGFGNWKDLITEKRLTTSKKLEWDPQMQGQFFGVMLPGNPVRQIIDNRTYSQIRAGTGRKSEATTFQVYLLAGGPEEPGPVWRAQYRKGMTLMLDGYMISDMKFAKFTPGRFAVAFTRRGRSTPDRIAVDSETVSAWGVVRKRNDRSVELEAPEIEGMPVSGVQQYEVPADAEFYFLGRKLSAEEVDGRFREGALIRVYPARPQTILVGEK